MTNPTAPTGPTNDWLDLVTAEIADDPARITHHFPAVGRKVGRDPLRADDPQALHGSVDDVARAGLIATLLRSTDATRASALLTDLYRHGDDAERRGVLRGLGAIGDEQPDLIATGIDLINDALRTNDPRLVAAAMGDFAGAHLPAIEWRGGVLKCLFMQIPLAAVSRVEDRRDADLKVQAENLANERRAAGRVLSPDLTALITDQPIPA